MSHLPASEALSRFTVLDLTRVRAGPTCVRQLADWGANVIKIEMPERGPDGNALGGPRAGPDFQNLHRNKRSMTLNLKDEAGRAVFMALAGRAVRWKSPPRGDSETGWRYALTRHGLHTLVGVLWAAIVWWLNPSYRWWMLPVVGALILSIPLSWVFFKIVEVPSHKLSRRVGDFVRARIKKRPQPHAPIAPDVHAHRA